LSDVEHVAVNQDSRANFLRKLAYLVTQRPNLGLMLNRLNLAICSRPQWKHVVAACDRVRATLGWEPRFNDLQTIVAHALLWERKFSKRAG